MSAPSVFTQGPADLESVIATAQLSQRPVRRANAAAETLELLRLQSQLAESPRDFFQKLVDAALRLSGADSTGISLLNELDQCFVWPAIAGALNPYLGQGTPRSFGPCGTVLDRNEALLMVHPERHFAYLGALESPLEEVLLIPFYLNGNAVGTIWAVVHQPGRKFDAEHRRLLESLSAFAASAYQALVGTGQIEPFLRKLP